MVGAVRRSCCLELLGRAGVGARGLAPMLPGREKEGSRELPTGPSRGSGQLIGDSGL